MDKPIVVVGAGQAAASLISRLVTLGNKSPVLLIGDEPLPPYQRPPLSKKYLLGELERERLFIRPIEWYANNDIITRFGRTVTSIHRAEKRIEIEAGERIEYQKLILCTGSRARQLPARIGGELPGVYSLRNMADLDRMAPEFQAGHKLLIIGGGYIGLEAAAVARQLGLEVTLIEMAPRILQRVAAEQTSNYFRQLHLSNGVTVIESAELAKLTESGGRVSGAELVNGQTIAADLVLVGIGGLANSELAQLAGLECDNGVAVNRYCQTSDPDIYAAGDCCSFMRNNVRIRLESVQNASDQGDVTARHLAGEKQEYDALPWFWSDQYDCKLQIAGLNIGHNHTVMRPGSSEMSLSVWYYCDDRLLAVDAMNDVKAYAFGRKIISAGINPAPELIADPATDLKTLSK